MTDAYLQPYLDAQRTHGTDFDVTLWARPETQRRRFDVFCQMLYLEGKTVLDAGCSRGDFAAYMLERGITYGTFIGVDGVPEVIEFANGRGLPNSRFLAGDFVKTPSLLATDSPQIVTISGSLNTMDAETAIRVLEG
ncbi:MAG: methyltransferase domain-containing protein, partial [Planctomycetota bacterium]